MESVLSVGAYIGVATVGTEGQGRLGINAAAAGVGTMRRPRKKPLPKGVYFSFVRSLYENRSTLFIGMLTMR